jgi:hypothetical protein
VDDEPLPSVEAEFQGRCSACDEPIFPGERIARLPDDDEWVHADCARNEGYEVSSS